MAVARCWDCRLVDPYNGQGDGIGSCECPRCEHCGGRPLRCDCSDEDVLTDEEAIAAFEDDREDWVVR